MPEHLAPAKINLALHVTGQRSDGYHELDTLVVFAEIGDCVRVTRQDECDGPADRLSVSGPFGSRLPVGDDNLVLRAVTAFSETLQAANIDHAPVAVHLEKNLPPSSGIGGGSADAAVTLHLLKEIWVPDIDVDLMPLARGLGCDVPMSIVSKPLRARGTGDILSFPAKSQPLNLVLANPGIAVSTPAVFQSLKQKNNAPIELETSELSFDVETIRPLRNDLASPATRLHPEINQVLAALEKSGSLLSRMSGSGATCFGIYETESAAKSAASELAAAYPAWWCIATRSTGA